MKFNELFKLIMEAGGQESGKLELVKTDLAAARKFAEEIMEKNGRSLDEEIPNFDDNYSFAQKQAGSGWTQRKDMPVITDDDVKKLQSVLSTGAIDRNAPYYSDTDIVDPFPEGLSGKEAEEFLSRGLEIHDGELKDDAVKIKKAKVQVGKLSPIQQQIYFDKSIAPIAEFGADASGKFMSKGTTFITSSDNYIIDGHHRYLGSMLLDPGMMVNCLKIDLPISELLPLTLAFGDAIGNSRNK